ncbi:hypothetical protein ACT6NV_05485 [Robiginitalea sp. IMCC44478]|uniref:hypothetical protein n=1 Tax=Robiginitalea sp. IMCC44478 TaxID=3459122 RepID=UPI004041A513
MKKSITTLSVFLLVFVNSSNVSSQTKETQTENAIRYFHQRNEAIGLVKNEKWQESLPILEHLTKVYQNDGDLFYLLGLSYYQIEQYQNAINALKKALDLGGTILTGIPTGSAPSNDIMIKIAKAYAEDGDKSNALLWLQKGFASRYDEKPFLIGDDAFKSFSEDKDFKELFGIDTQENITREEAWTRDITYLEKRINELHYNPNHVLSKKRLTDEFVKLRSHLASLSDTQIIVKIMRIIGSLGNGHNLIIPTSPINAALKKLPVQFYQFYDGLFIVDAEEGFEQWIGYKVESFDSTPVEVALQLTNAVNARDNSMQTLWLGPYYLTLPDVLKELGITENSDDVTLTLSKDIGKSQKVTLNTVKWNFTGFPKMPTLKDIEQPLFLSKIDDPYWYQLLPEHNTIYLQFNVVTQKEGQSLKELNTEVRGQITQNKIQNFILDLRHNHGGNGSILPPMLKTIINFEVMNPDGRIFVLMGRETFSAGQNLLTDITKNTSPILVGEPSGSKPNHIGEAGWFRLPYSGLMGLISTQFHQTSKAEDNRKWIAPHIPVNMSSTDYFNGTDKALNIILELIKPD